MTAHSSAFDANPSAVSASFVTAPPDRASAPSPFRVDEGYSEDPPTPVDSDVEPDTAMKDGLDHSPPAQNRVSAARQWLLSQPVEIRAGQPFLPPAPP